MALDVFLRLDDQWVSVADRIRYEAGVEIERGKESESDFTSSALTFVGDNRDLFWSSDVPGTENYDRIARGTLVKAEETQIVDTFTRSASSGWGTCETPAVAWQIGSGSASDYSVTGGVGRHTLTTTSTVRQTRIELTLRASMVLCSVTIGATAATAAARASVVLRKTPNGTGHYRAELEYTTSGTVTANLVRLGGPGTSTLATASAGSYSPSQKWWIRFLAVGSQLYMSAWADGSDEPTDWLCTAEDVHFRRGQLALRSVRDSGNTNSNLTFDFDDLVLSEPRFFGEIWSLKPMSDKSGRDLTMTVEASGILRRLSNTSKPIRSPLYQAVSEGAFLVAVDPPVAYWPLEDGDLATQLEAVGSGVRPGYFYGADTASDATLPGSEALPSVSVGGLIAGSVPAFSGFNAATDTWTFNFLVKIDDLPEAETVIARIGTSEAAACYEIAMNTTGEIIFRAPKLFQLLLDAYVFSTSRSYNSLYNLAAPTLFGRWVIFTLYNVPSGPASYDVVLQWTDALASTASSMSLSPGGGTTVWREPNGSWQLFGPADGTRSFGHVSTFADFGVYSAQECSGWVGERARNRFSRLCEENDIEVQTLGTAAEKMGPQLVNTLVANLEDCAATDLGVARESRHVFGVEFYSHEHRYSQLPAATVDCGGVFEGLGPIRDDSNVATAVVATRDGGTAQTYVVPADDTFHLGSGTVSYPGVEVVGLVGASISPNVQTDLQASSQASWHAHLRASKDARFEELTFQLMSPAFLSDPQLAFDVAGLAEGDVVKLTGPPAWMHPCPPELQVLGLREFTQVRESASGALTVQRQLTFNTVPAKSWEAWSVDTALSTIEVAKDDDDTSITVATSLGPDWKTSPDPPFAVQGMVGGEAMLVTGCTTATPAFIAAGTIANGNNASVVPGLPAGMTADTGQSMYCIATIRNSGTGVPNQPTGWSTLVNNGNMKVFHKYYVTGDAAPTITFTGGVANADTQARIVAFSGVSPYYGGAFSQQNLYKQSPGSTDTTNSSAQNMAYGNYYVHRNNCVVMLFGWKQDDWTGVAPPAGFTEMVDNATTTGDDSGIAAYYQIQTTATNITAGSMVVTGGASAISRTTVVAFRPQQTLVVERSLNGVVGSLTPAEHLHVYRHGVMPL